MNIDIRKAINKFYGSSSLPMVYGEAVANAFDAGANKINIELSIKTLSDEKSFSLIISDNGSGFTDERFKRFSELLNTEDESHKGLGRLVYLDYFSKVRFISHYGDTQRSFDFSLEEEGVSNEKIIKEQSSSSGTQMVFSGYQKSRIRDKEFVTPRDIYRRLLDEFLPRFYMMKKDGYDFEITISLNTQDGKDNPLHTGTETLNAESLPVLEEKEFDRSDIDLFESKITMLYSVEKTDGPSEIFTAFCVDNRSVKLSLIDGDKIPANNRVIVLLFSSLVDVQTNESRQELNIEETKKKQLKEFLLRQVATFLGEKFPEIRDKNERMREKLSSRFPHLDGYFSTESIGLVNENETLNGAQEKFFTAQKRILNVEGKLTGKQYAEAMEQASRVLMEYVLYRNFTIARLEDLDPLANEAEIHNIITPMKKAFHVDEHSDCLFTNNAWVLDDRYMNYSCILSDQSLQDLLNELKIDDEHIDVLRPDIAVIFSKDIQEQSHTGVDVVIVELKKVENKLLDDVVVIEQLRQRARRLLKYYGGRIQRIWYYGIVGFSEEFRESIVGDSWTRLYSNGDMYYKEFSERPGEGSPRVPVGIFLNSFTSLISDAKARNEAFMNILRCSVKQEIKLQGN